MSEGEFDKRLTKLRDAATVLRKELTKKDVEPDPSGSEKPSAIEEPTRSAEEIRHECVAKKQQAGMTQEEAMSACSGGGDSATKDNECISTKMAEGMSESEAKSACAPKQDTKKWAKPYVGKRGTDNQYTQIVGPYLIEGVETPKVEYDTKTGLYRDIEE